jgi:MoaA/NifB/PqqE/SkfB family radical SAM enzyme
MAEYFMPKRGSSFLNKVYTWLKTGKRFRPSFPRAVEFQTLSACNARCLFCPHSQNPKLIPHGRMDDGLIEAIIEECSRHFVGRISPYLTNEPLLDARMPDILAAIHKRCHPLIKTKINSNASLLTEDVGRRLMDSGLSQLWFSVNGYSPETYRASMGLDFHGAMANIDAFLALKKKLGRRRPGVKVTTLNTELVRHELPHARQYWAARGVPFKVHHMDNRAGSLPPGIAPQPFSPKKNCDLFLKQAYIVENGDMILCCHDWRQTVVLGNITRSSIREIWNSPSFLERIYEYYARDFRNIAICRTCG